MVKRLRRYALCRKETDRPIRPTCPLHITTGTVALLFKPHALPSVKATTLKKIFRVFRAFRGQKKWVVGGSPRQVFRVFRGS